MNQLFLFYFCSGRETRSARKRRAAACVWRARAHARDYTSDRAHYVRGRLVDFNFFFRSCISYVDGVTKLLDNVANQKMNWPIVSARFLMIENDSTCEFSGIQIFNRTILSNIALFYFTFDFVLIEYLNIWHHAPTILSHSSHAYRDVDIHA